MNASEKRIHKREDFRQPVRFDISAFGRSAEGGVEKRGEVTNISSGGIGLQSGYPLEKGEILKLYLPTMAKNIAPPVFTEVVWVRRFCDSVEAGLRFIG